MSDSDPAGKGPADPVPGSPEFDSAQGRREFLTIFPSIMLPMFLAVVDQTIVATALPAIAASFGEAERLSWVVVAYLVSTTIAAPVYGKLGDIFGRRRLMFIALIIFMISSILCALSENIVMLTLSRVLQGAGGGGLMTLSQALVGEAVPPRQRASYQGYLAAVAVTSSAFGPVAGGFLTEHFGWQSVFLVNLPVGVGALLLTFRLSPRPGTGENFTFDALGLFLFAAFITSTLLMLQQAQGLVTGAFVLPTILTAVALVAVVLLIWRERRARSPLLPIPLLKHPAIWRCDTLAICHGATLVSLITFLPIYFRMVHGASAATTGLLMLPMTIGIGIGSVATGRIVGRSGRTAIYPSVGLTVAVVMMFVFAYVSPYLDALTTALLFGVFAVFIGSVMGVVQLTVQVAAGARQLGTGAASVQFSRSLGAALGTALVGTVLFSTFSLASPGEGEAFARILQVGPQVLQTLTDAEQSAILNRLNDAFRNAFLCIGCFTVCGMYLAWTLPVRRI